MSRDITFVPPGRTGTELACIAVLARIPLADVVGWVRSHYHPWAVDVPEQEAMISRFARWAESRSELKEFEADAASPSGESLPARGRDGARRAEPGPDRSSCSSSGTY